MSDDENFIKKTKSIIAVLQDFYNNKNWNASLPLKVLKKRVGAYISQLEHDVENIESSSNDESKDSNAKNIFPAGYIKIYIMLHQSDGENLKSWNTSLLSLTSSVLGRAVYASEHEAIKVLSYKEYKEKEGYAELWVPEDVIINLPAEKSVFDRDGQKILSLKQKAIKVENIKYFSHALGNKYEFINSAITLVVE
jgi:Dot/Icm secretion system protein IcmQ